MRDVILHVRHLTKQLDVGWWNDQLAGARAVFAGVGINLVEASTQRHVFGDDDGVISVGFCTDDLTDEQLALFGTVSGTDRTHITVFIVSDLDPSGWMGCAKHPKLQPGLLLVQGSSANKPWVLGHELGHVMGLPDCGDSDRLMFESTWWTGQPRPTLIQTEVDTITASMVLQPPRVV